MFPSGPPPNAIPPTLDLTDYAVTGKYSDLEIRCKDSTYAVHRLVLCSQIKFFAKACDGPFKEASERVIDLSHDDPIAVRSMIQFAYMGSYESIDSSNSQSNVLQLVYIYAIAAKYDVPGLAKTAKNDFKASLQQFWDDKAEAEWVADIIRAVYGTTCSEERGLRDVLADALVNQHPDVIQESHDSPIQRALEEIGAFSRDCLVAMTAKHKRNSVAAQKDPRRFIRAYWCRRCAKYFMGLDPAPNCVRCSSAMEQL